MKFSGRFSEFSLPDLLRILIQTQKVGYVSVFYKGNESRIYVKQGQLHHAESDGLMGESAVFNLLTYDPGSEFEFFELSTLPGKTIQSDLDTIIQNGIAYLEKWRKMTKTHPKITINSEISLKMGKGGLKVNPTPDKILTVLEGASDNTLKLHQLASILERDIFKLIDQLIGLEEQEKLRIIGEERLELRRFFVELANTIYSEFESISGLKLKQDIEQKLQKLILEKDWNLLIYSGKILEDKTKSDTIEEQKALYREYLQQLIELIAPIYGNTFIQQVIHKVGDRFPGNAQKWLDQLQIRLN